MTCDLGESPLNLLSQMTTSGGKLTVRGREGEDKRGIKRG